MLQNNHIFQVRILTILMCLLSRSHWPVDWDYYHLYHYYNHYYHPILSGVLAGAGGSVGLSLVIWVICASIATCGALCYTELSLTSGKSGGEFIFILEHFGPVLAFLRMWTILAIIMPCISAIQGITIANYLTTPFFSDCEHVPVDAIRLIAVVVICKFLDADRADWNQLFQWKWILPLGRANWSWSTLIHEWLFIPPISDPPSAPLSPSFFFSFNLIEGGWVCNFTPSPLAKQLE